MQYTTEAGDGLFSGTQLFFYSPMTLTFTGDEGKVPGTGGVIEANTRIDNQDPVKQRKIDFLWDSKTGVDKKDFSAANPDVNFTFTHKMSKVTFTFLRSDPVYDYYNPELKLADGVEVSDMVSYKLDGLVLDGTFDTATGVCAVKEDAGAETLAIEFKKGDVESGKELSPLILFPQTLSGGSLKLHIYTDELDNPDALQHYNCALTFSDGVIKPGCHYKYTIKVTKLGLIVGKMTIESWTEKDSFMTATIDGEKIFEEQE